jgi:hypothetical protein
MDTQFLTEHFTWAEANVTLHRDIDNTIPEEVKANILHSAKQMERVRALLNLPISISSWYRCPELNTAVKGSKTSQHMLGFAIDFICPKFGTPAQVVKKISEFPELIRFDQLILEHTWVHISFANPLSSGKREVLSLLHSGGYAQGITDRFGAKINGLG